MLYGTIAEGVARVNGATVEVLDIPYRDLSQALECGFAQQLGDKTPVRTMMPLSEVKPLAPLPRPRAIWAAGLSYPDHLREVAQEVGVHAVNPHPSIFLKASSSVAGPLDPIVLPAIAPDAVDYEGEVAVVIGRRAKGVSVEDAWDYVFGLTAANDVSARDVQFGRYSSGRQTPTLGKSFETFTPMGPWVASTDMLPNRNDVGLRTLVDDEVRQEARTGMLIYPVPVLVSFISHFTTLEPGDVVLTGTPSGVGMTQERYLKQGQVVCVEVEIVGSLENSVVLAPSAGFDWLPSAGSGV